MSRRILPLCSLVLLFTLLLAACGGATPATNAPEATAGQESSAPTATQATDSTAVADTEAPTEAPAETAPPATNTPVAINTFDEAEAGDRTVITWFVGLGIGGDPEAIAAEEAVVEEFNNSQDRIYLSLQIVSNNVAANTLATQIAAGNVPDVVGPVGTEGRAGLNGQFLDLTELIAKNNVDLSGYDPALVRAYNLPDQGQIGLPFAVFPSFLYFNKDLFDEAGLAYPPQEFGAQYEGKEWNFETLRELAMQLTVDANGNDATSPDFDGDNISQFGFELQYGGDARAMGTMFGASNFVDDSGKAVIPPVWLDAWKWFRTGMFEEHWMPNDAYRNSDLLGRGNTFNTGRVAMAYGHLWYTCCIEAPSAGGKVKNWDIGVVPSYNGNTTAKLHADTFVIMKGSKNPDAAFEVYQYLINNEKLFQTYGAMPAITALQSDFFAGLDEKFAPNDINWQVAIDSLAYPDIPNHQEYLPNVLKARQAIGDFNQLLNNDPDMDVDAEATKLQETLQGIYDEQQ